MLIDDEKLTKNNDVFNLNKNVAIIIFVRFRPTFLFKRNMYIKKNNNK